MKIRNANFKRIVWSFGISLFFFSINFERFIANSFINVLNNKPHTIWVLMLILQNYEWWELHSSNLAHQYSIYIITAVLKSVWGGNQFAQYSESIYTMIIERLILISMIAFFSISISIIRFWCFHSFFFHAVG